MVDSRSNSFLMLTTKLHEKWTVLSGFSDIYNVFRVNVNMRIVLIFALLLAVNPFCFGQAKSLEITKYPDGDTNFWYKWQQPKFNEIGLADLTKSTDTLHFRFSTETQVIDVWTRDYKSFAGTFANYTTKYHEQKVRNGGYGREKTKPNKFYSEKSPMDSATARKIYNLFTSLSVFNIPCDDSIEGWSSGNDGTTYFIENSTPTKYSFRTYWSPHSYRNKIKEALIIDSLAKQLEAILDMQAPFGTFIQSLPRGCYHAGSMMITCTQYYQKEKRRKK